MPKPHDFIKEESLDQIEFVYDESSPLANVFQAPMIYGGIEYKSSEHVYHAMKFNPNTCADIIEQIILADDPVESKRIAHRFKRRMRKDWDSIKFRVMIDIVYQKMLQHPEIASILINSDKYLVEESPDDHCWGMVTNGEGVVSGSNFMGRILMIVRKRLEKEKRNFTEQ